MNIPRQAVAEWSLRSTGLSLETYCRDIINGSGIIKQIIIKETDDKGIPVSAMILIENTMYAD